MSLRGDGVLVAPSDVAGSGHSYESFQVLLCPVELCPRSRKASSHAPTSPRTRRGSQLKASSVSADYSGQQGFRGIGKGAAALSTREARRFRSSLFRQEGGSPSALLPPLFRQTLLVQAVFGPAAAERLPRVAPPLFGCAMPADDTRVGVKPGLTRSASASVHHGARRVGAPRLGAADVRAHPITAGVLVGLTAARLRSRRGHTPPGCAMPADDTRVGVKPGLGPHLLSRSSATLRPGPHSSVDRAEVSETAAGVARVAVRGRPGSAF